MVDVRFSTALQILLSLTLAEREGVRKLSSSQLAEGVDSNPSFVRKLLAPLLDAGLIVSTLGRDGGLALGRAPESIALLDVYRAVNGDKPVWPAHRDVPHRCVVSRNVEVLFRNLTADVDTAIAATLAGRTLASAFAEIEKMDAR